jgi:hypothetical protein
VTTPSAATPPPSRSTARRPTRSSDHRRGLRHRLDRQRVRGPVRPRRPGARAPVLRRVLERLGRVGQPRRVGSGGHSDVHRDPRCHKVPCRRRLDIKPMVCTGREPERAEQCDRAVPRRYVPNKRPASAKSKYSSGCRGQDSPGSPHPRKPERPHLVVIVWIATGALRQPDISVALKMSMPSSSSGNQPLRGVQPGQDCCAPPVTLSSLPWLP